MLRSIISSPFHPVCTFKRCYGMPEKANLFSIFCSFENAKAAWDSEVLELDFYKRFLYFAVSDISVSKLDPKRRRTELMITLTPGAIEKVKSILAEHKDETGLRIAVVGGGCSGFQYQMTLDKEPQADDKVLDMEGLRVFVDARSILYLNGTKVDYIDGLNGSGFKFDNPNAKASCGCGESFDA
jgi:iron-sulfur cluster assembly protein